MEGLVFEIMTLEVGTTKIYFRQYDIWIKTSHVILQLSQPLLVSAQLHIVMQPRFQEKSFYVKLTTFSVAENIEFGTKLKPYSESSSKTRLRSCWTFAWKQEYVISQKLQMPDFIKAILESSYKVLLGTCNLTTLKRPVFLLTALEF